MADAGGRRWTDSPLHPVSRTALAVAIFLATASLTFLSFISLELALLCFAGMALGSIVYVEGRRRSLWELGAFNRFKAIRDMQGAHERDITAQAQDIEALKTDMQSVRSEIARTKIIALAAQSASPASAQSAPPSGAQSRIPRQPAPAAPAPSSPRTVRPGAPEDTPASHADPQESADDYEGLSDTVVRELLYNALERRQVDVFVQPIVRLPQR
jgi:hypothetical protein